MPAKQERVRNSAEDQGQLLHSIIVQIRIK